jgi:hypothetical protein
MAHEPEGYVRNCWIFPAIGHGFFLVPILGDILYGDAPAAQQILASLRVPESRLFSARFVNLLLGTSVLYHELVAAFSWFRGG